MSEENVELVERAIEVVQRQGPRALFAQGLAAPDAEWHAAPELPGAARYVGADGFAEFLRIWTEDLDEWSLKLERVRSEGDCVLAYTQNQAIGKGSGVPVEMAVVMLFEVRDGVIHQVRAFIEEGQALEAAGLSE